jgi:hypothetical protein
MEPKKIFSGGGLSALPLLQHGDLVSRQGRVGENPFQHGGANSTEFERHGKKNRFGGSEP